MRDLLLNAWRGRRVLLLGGADRPTLFMQALLVQLGARPARISPDADADRLSRAMTQGRIGAVIVPQACSLAPGDSLPARLSALLCVLSEVREAGVPLSVLCSDAAVYRTALHPAVSREDDPIGGETQEGFFQSILQLTADGAARGLLGDPVSVLIARHMPCLGCGHPVVSAYDGWCASLLQGEPLRVPAPGRQGVFLHPLDMCCGALLLGARHLLRDRGFTGALNLGVSPQNLIANRTAALRLIARSGGTRPILEGSADAAPPFTLIDGAKARFLCGAQCLLTGDEALDDLLALHRAAPDGTAQHLQEIKRQTQAYALRIP